MRKRAGFLLLLWIVLLTGLCSCSFVAGSVNKQDSDKVIIALLDTGISEEAIEGQSLLSGYNYVMDSEDTQDKVNHGTAVASAILGSERAGVSAIAPDACLVPLVIVTEKDGKMCSVSPEVFARAIRDSVDVYGADIINVSLGIYKDAPELRAAVEYAQEQGVLVVAAVGNGGGGESFKRGTVPDA